MAVGIWTNIGNYLAEYIDRLSLIRLLLKLLIIILLLRRRLSERINKHVHSQRTNGNTNENAYELTQSVFPTHYYLSPIIK